MLTNKLQVATDWIQMSYTIYLSSFQSVNILMRRDRKDKMYKESKRYCISVDIYEG